MATVFRLRFSVLLQPQQRRLFSVPSEMRAWEIHSFSATVKESIERQLKMTTTRRIRPLSKPSDVLIRVQAASLNPIDGLMLTGYGASSFRSLRTMSNPSEDSVDFPLTPGRDFAGEVVLTGPEASDIEDGAQVIGANWPHTSSIGGGSLAEFVICPRENLAIRPTNAAVSPTEAAALSYAGLTAWAALQKAGVKPANAVNPFSRVLVTGVSGAVGSLTAQLVRLAGASHLGVTCSASANEAELKASLHADEIIFAPDLPPVDAHYDLIIDCVRPKILSTNPSKISFDFFKAENFFPLLRHLEPGCNSRYVALNPPVLGFVDQWGLVMGLGGSGLSLLSSVIQSNPAALNWAFFQPSGANLQQLVDWLAQGRIHVPIDSVFAFTETKAAFTKMLQRGNKGKIVVTVP